MLFVVILLIGSFIRHGDSARATELIFRKTTTTTTEESILEESSNKSMADSFEDEVKDKPKLTGVPQIDYIYDPNLPRELNGYNLSTYPFLDAVPPEEELEFVCDGLHDGFYASVKFNCQLYHHCLYGVRYDFLCANFTAFDQKTFICHFASEVDCKNSPRYFYRNDALYKASSTTEAPTTTTTTTTTIAPIKTTPVSVQQEPKSSRPNRPFRRRPPVFDDYYDDYYYYDETERPVRYRRPYVREHLNDYGESRRTILRPRKQGGRRKQFYTDRRPYAYDEYDETDTKPVTVKKETSENVSILEGRKPSIPVAEKETTVLTSEVNQKISSGKKLSIYLQPRPPSKFNGKLTKSIATTTTTMPLKQDNTAEYEHKSNRKVATNGSSNLAALKKNYRYNDQYYDDYVYDEADENVEPPSYKTLVRNSPYKQLEKKENSDQEKLVKRPAFFNRGAAPIRPLKYAYSTDN